MKKTIPFIIIALFLFSCGNKSNGDKKGRKKIEHQYYCEICIDTLDVNMPYGITIGFSTVLDPSNNGVA